MGTLVERFAELLERTNPVPYIRQGLRDLSDGKIGSAYLNYLRSVPGILVIGGAISKSAALLASSAGAVAIGAGLAPGKVEGVTALVKSVAQKVGTLAYNYSKPAQSTATAVFNVTKNVVKQAAKSPSIVAGLKVSALVAGIVMAKHLQQEVVNDKGLLSGYEVIKAYTSFGKLEEHDRNLVTSWKTNLVQLVYEPGAYLLSIPLKIKYAKEAK